MDDTAVIRVDAQQKAREFMQLHLQLRAQLLEREREIDELRAQQSLLLRQLTALQLELGASGSGPALRALQDEGNALRATNGRLEEEVVRLAKALVASTKENSRMAQREAELRHLLNEAQVPLPESLKKDALLLH